MVHQFSSQFKMLIRFTCLVVLSVKPLSQFPFTSDKNHVCYLPIPHCEMHLFAYP